MTEGAETGYRQRKPILSTITAPQDASWNAVVEAMGPPVRGRAGGPADLMRLWKASRGRNVLILRGSVAAEEFYRDLVLTLLIKLRRNKPRIILFDATWEARSRFLERKAPWAVRIIPSLARFVIKRLDGPHVTYAVLSSEEVSAFPETWGVSGGRVQWTRFPHTLLNGDENMPTRDEGYLFAGGNSLRDYDLLEEALRGAQFETRVASTWKPVAAAEHIKAGRVQPDEFVQLMAGARACVVPLKSSARSAGQQTYLNAMALAKPVVVTDSWGVRDYIADGDTGIIAGRTPAELRDAIERVMKEECQDDAQEMGARARAVVLREHTQVAWRRSLLEMAGFPPGVEVP